MRTSIKLLTIVIILLFSVSLLAQGKGKFVGSTLAKKFHTQDCAAAKKIAKANLIEFNSAEEAKAKGYEPCKTCKPDQPDGAKPKVKETKKETLKEVKEAGVVKKEAAKEAKVVKKDAAKEAEAVKKAAVKETKVIKKDAAKDAKEVKKEAEKEKK